MFDLEFVTYLVEAKKKNIETTREKNLCKFGKQAIVPHYVKCGTYVNESTLDNFWTSPVCHNVMNNL